MRPAIPVSPRISKGTILSYTILSKIIQDLLLLNFLAIYDWLHQLVVCYDLFLLLHVKAVDALLVSWFETVPDAFSFQLCVFDFEFQTLCRLGFNSVSMLFRNI
jgi:hypothetical protein